MKGRSNPALRGQAGLGNVIAVAASDTRDNSAPLPQIQASYLAARFGLDRARAKLTAELAWGRA